MFAAKAAWAQLPDPTIDPTKAQVRRALERAFAALGASRTEKDFVLALIDRTQDCDWRAGHAPIAAPQTRWLADTLQIGPTRLKGLARRCAELGLIWFKDSATGARWVKRTNRTGPIVEGHGFDLTPLRRRLGEMQAAIAATAERGREADALRRAIFSARRRIRELADLAARLAMTDAGEFTASADHLAALDRCEVNPEILAPVLVEIEALYARLERRVTALAGTEGSTASHGNASAFSVESDPKGSRTAPPNTTTNPDAYASTVSEAEKPLSRLQVEVDEGGSRRLAAPKAERVRSRRPTQPGIEDDADVLRGFVATPSFVLKIAAAFRGAVTSARPSQTELIEAAHYVSARLGISQHAWGQACMVFGRYPAAVCLAVIAARHERGEVTSPGGLMRAMIERHRAGTLRLDRSLFGLADNLTHTGHA